MITREATGKPLPDRARRRRGRRRRWRWALTVAAAALPVFFWSCLASPVPGLWPPQRGLESGEPQREVEVLFRDWHTVIVEVLPPPAGGFREWQYAEKAWYLEGRQGVSGAIRALCWPTASAVGKEESPVAYAERFPAEGLRRWKFTLSGAGQRAMEEFLQAEVGAPLPEWPGWYEGVHRYHLFNGCHHFTAGALRAAGLPLRPWWAFNGWLIGLQLDRSERLARESP